MAAMVDRDRADSPRCRGRRRHRSRTARSGASLAQVQVDGLWRRPVIGTVLGDHIGIDATAHVELGGQPMKRGEVAATRSSRMRLVTAS